MRLPPRPPVPPPCRLVPDLSRLRPSSWLAPLRPEVRLDALRYEVRCAPRVMGADTLSAVLKTDVQDFVAMRNAPDSTYALLGRGLDEVANSEEAHSAGMDFGEMMKIHEIASKHLEVFGHPADESDSAAAMRALFGLEDESERMMLGKKNPTVYLVRAPHPPLACNRPPPVSNAPPLSSLAASCYSAPLHSAVLLTPRLHSHVLPFLKT